MSLLSCYALFLIIFYDSKIVFMRKIWKIESLCYLNVIVVILNFISKIKLKSFLRPKFEEKILVKRLASTNNSKKFTSGLYLPEKFSLNRPYVGFGNKYEWNDFIYS